MAENMIKFLRGNVADLPGTATAGALYFTKDEGIYLGMDNGSYHRYGDFITVENVKALPEAGAHETCMYYCVAENILAKYDSVKGWQQINKQPTAAELKTLLGLGSMAYKSEVAEADLNSNLATKINNAFAANHGHENKGVIDGITAEKVAAWDAAEGNAKAYADGLDKAMDERVDALEAAIGEDGSVAAQIKTAIETLDYTDTAVTGEYVSAVNEVDGKISVTRATLPDYSNTYDAKGAADTAFENAKAYADGLAANYDEKGAAAAVKTELSAEIAKKVEKEEGKSLIADTEISRLATLANYDDTEVKADIAKKADAAEMTTELGKKVDKVEGYSLVADAEIERLAGVTNYNDTALAGRVTAAEGKITALEGASATHATKDELAGVDAKFADYKTVEAQKAIDDEQDRRLGVIEGDYLKAADIANFETKENVEKVADDLAAYVESNDAAIADRYTKEEADAKFALIADAYDDEEVRGLISDNADAIAAEAERAAGIEAGLRTDVDAIAADYLKAEDKTELQDNIDTLTGVVETLRDGIDADKVDGVKDLIDYVDKHGAVVTGMQEGIAANTKAISDEAARADAAEKALAGRLDTLEAIDHDAYVGADAALKAELQKEIDDDVKAAIEAEVTRANGAYDAKGAAADAQAAAEATAAGALATAREEITAEIGEAVEAVADDLAEYVEANDAAVAANAAAITAGDEATLGAAKAYCEGLMTWGSF